MSHLNVTSAHIIPQTTPAVVLPYLFVCLFFVFDISERVQPNKKVARPLPARALDVLITVDVFPYQARPTGKPGISPEKKTKAKQVFLKAKTDMLCDVVSSTSGC